VKRTFGILAGVAALGLAAYVGTRVWAQQGAISQPSAPLASRIAVINIVYVLKNYNKFQALEANLKAKGQQIEATLDPKKKEIDRLKTKYQAPSTTAQEREQIEREVRKIQREMEETTEDARKQLTKEQGALAVQVYQEIQEAATTYARNTGANIEMVLHFTEALDRADVYSPGNIQRKIQAGGLMPMYVDPRMDITVPVVQMLNQRYPAAAPVQR
jgi:Skp family chaperone for outer membrane proteins